jgi:hypothetical protein
MDLVSCELIYSHIYVVSKQPEILPEILLPAPGNLNYSINRGVVSEANL